MFGLGFSEILVILGICLIVLGPERLPQLAKTLGRALGELRRASDEFKREISSSVLLTERDAFKEEIRDIRKLIAEPTKLEKSQLNTITAAATDESVANGESASPHTHEE